jgi:hypothetical protein
MGLTLRIAEEEGMRRQREGIHAQKGKKWRLRIPQGEQGLSSMPGKR